MGSRQSQRKITRIPEIFVNVNILYVSMANHNDLEAVKYLIDHLYTACWVIWIEQTIDQLLVSE